MKNKTLLTLCAAPLLLSVNAMAEVKGAFIIEDNLLTIDENYAGDYAFDNWDADEKKFFKFIDSDKFFTIKFNREFQANIPATIVFPIIIPPPLAEGITSNADFYDLQYVIPDFRDGNRTWLAKMKKIDIEDLSGNTPYAVIARENGPITINNISGYAGWMKAPDDDLNPYEICTIKEYYCTENGNYNGELPDVTYPVANNAGDWYFTANYSNGTYKSGDPEVGLCYGFEGSNDGDVPKGQFGKIANGTVKKAFRGLLCKKDNTVQLPAPSNIKQNGGAAKSANVFSIPETINVEFVDTDANGKEHTTYVGKLNRIDNVRLNRERSTFDLKGRNVDGKRTAKGVYLKK